MEFCCRKKVCSGTFLSRQGFGWGEWSKCSRSCGGGVSFRQRHCSRDFRAEQCAEFDGTEFQGKKYKWLPYYGGNDKHVGLLFIATYQQYEAVVDGTTCEPGKRDICVEGVCQVSHLDTSFIRHWAWQSLCCLPSLHLTFHNSIRKGESLSFEVLRSMWKAFLWLWT
uniref:Uncharacterized protein n=1 Tax=Cyanistes caeruleus TaxID=156563 RepID=A0A8C0UQM0_CYACU